MIPAFLCDCLSKFGWVIIHTLSMNHSLKVSYGHLTHEWLSGISHGVATKSTFNIEASTLCNMFFFLLFQETLLFVDSVLQSNFHLLSMLGCIALVGTSLMINLSRTFQMRTQFTPSAEIQNGFPLLYLIIYSQPMEVSYLQCDRINTVSSCLRDEY